MWEPPPRHQPPFDLLSKLLEQDVCTKYRRVTHSDVGEEELLRRVCEFHHLSNDSHRAQPPPGASKSRSKGEQDQGRICNLTLSATHEQTEKRLRYKSLLWNTRLFFFSGRILWKHERNSHKKLMCRFSRI